MGDQGISIFDRLILAFWLIFLSYWAFSARRAKRVVHRASRWVGLGPLVVALVAVLLLRLYGFSFQLISRSTGVLVFGTAMCGFGLALAIWGRKHLGTNWSREPSIQAGHELVTSGPYRFVRHPIYAGILAAIFGLVLVHGAVLLIMFGGMLLMFVGRIKREEEFMSQVFPSSIPNTKSGQMV